MKSNEFGRPEDPIDGPLRDAYRQLATERVPDRLDKAILDQAERAARPAGRTGLWAWRRPIAWMTMIGLTVAVVLEFNQAGTDLVPASPTKAVQPATPAPAAEADRATLSPAATQTDADKARRDRELETMSAPAGRSLNQAEPAPASSPSSAFTEKAARSSENQLREAAGQRGASYLSPVGDPDARACDEAARSDPERWRACIERLVAEGRGGDAAAELLLYRDAFPDAPLPALVR